MVVLSLGDRHTPVHVLPADEEERKGLGLGLGQAWGDEVGSPTLRREA